MSHPDQKRIEENLEASMRAGSFEFVMDYIRAERQRRDNLMAASREMLAIADEVEVGGSERQVRSFMQAHANLKSGTW